MGCATSVLPLNKRAGRGDHSMGLSGSENEHELALLTAAPPKVQLTVGEGLRKYEENGRNVVFVFGGPFSMKGLLVEELVSAFHFTVITTEDIVLNHLPNKAPLQTTQEIKDMLQTDPSVLSLEWVLNVVATMMDKATRSIHTRPVFLIDIVPNMHSILRMENFNKPDIRKEMMDLERRFPVLFALELVVSEEKLSNTYVAPGIAVKLNKPSGGGRANTPPSTADDDEGSSKTDKDKNKSTFAEGSDEMDSSRMKRRHDLYKSCAEPFLAYFEESNRVASVQVAPFQKEYVWKRLHEFFHEFGFPSKDTGRTVLLFAFSEEQVEGLDTLYYKMLKVSLSAIIGNKNDSLENMIKAVALYVKRSSSSSANHLVILDCLNSKMDTPPPRKINFLEVREYYLDHFIRIKSSTVKGRPFRRRFRAISATTNRVCLFPTTRTTQQQSQLVDDTELCKKIAFCFLLADEQTPAENGSHADQNKSEWEAVAADEGHSD